MKTRLAATTLAILTLTAACSSDGGAGESPSEPSPSVASTSAAPTADAQAQADAAKAQEDANARATEKAEADALAAAEAEALAAQKAEAGARGEELGWDGLEYAEIADRDLSVLVKDPEATVGANYILYGVVSQFDAATGRCSFRANISTELHEQSYEFNQNAMVGATDTQDCPLLDGVVQDDVVKMWLTSVGPYTYSTQIGGSTTVPSFAVRKIEVIG